MQDALGPAVGTHQPVPFRQVIVDVLHRPAHVARPVKLQNPLRLVHRNPVRARTAEPAVEQTCQAVVFIQATVPTGRALRHVEPLRRLISAQTSAPEPIVDILEPQHADLL